MEIGPQLTAHWQELLDLRAEFSGYALTTKRADREKLEHAIAGLYSLAGFDPPEHVVWFDSPVNAVLAGALWIEMLVPTMSASQAKQPVGSSLLSAQLYKHISLVDNYVPPDYRKLAKALQGPMLITTTGIVPDYRGFGQPPLGPNVIEAHPMYSGLGAGFKWTIHYAVGDAVRQQSHNRKEALLTIWNAVREFLPFQQESLQSLTERLSTLDTMQGKVLSNGTVLSKLTLRIGSLTSEPHHFSPPHNALMVASRYALRHFGIDLTDKLPMPQLLEAVKAGGWWWPFKSVCFACDNPKELHFEANWHRLHNENDMAIRFQDDWGFYVLHGHKVPEYIIQNRYSAKDIDAEPNMVIRSLMIERFGTGKYIMETGTEEIDRSDYGILYRKEHANAPDAPERGKFIMRFFEPIHMVRMTSKTPEADGSFREYFLRVPANIKTAREAVAWTFNLEENEYEPRPTTSAKDKNPTVLPRSYCLFD